MLNRLSRLHGQLPPARLVVQRFAHRTTPPVRRFRLKYLLIGVTVVKLGINGGELILNAGYSWYYHYSGIDHPIDVVEPTQLLLLQAVRESIAEEAPSRVLARLRAAYSAYVAHLPWAGSFVDNDFEGIENIVDTHVKKANTLIQYACIEMGLASARHQDTPRVRDTLRMVFIARQLAKDLKMLGVQKDEPPATNSDIGDEPSPFTTSFDVAESENGDS